jgi:hypothetical protein
MCLCRYLALIVPNITDLVPSRQRSMSCSSTAGFRTAPTDLRPAATAVAAPPETTDHCKKLRAARQTGPVAQAPGPVALGPARPRPATPGAARRFPQSTSARDEP